MNEPMTRLDVLDRVEQHFSQPGAVLGWEDENRRCMYRGDMDRHSPVRCAVGCLIPDELYDPLWDGAGDEGSMFAHRVLGWCSEVTELFDPEVERNDWLDEVQMLHDDIARAGGDAAEFVAKLRAKREELLYA